MFKIAVFVSGRGSNLKAIIKSIPDQLQNIEVSAVVSDQTECPALEYASGLNILTFTLSSKDKRVTSYTTLINKFKEIGIQLIVLAGFLKKIPDELVENYTDRIINIHPALLPSFGGKGMYGMNVHRAVFEKSCQVSGPTIHFVDKIYDNGKIIAQKTVDISDVESPEEIAKRVLKLEHFLLPYVIRKIADNKLIVKNNRVYLLE
jgi:formyltetrahydrofolate-dependent phosphoribosylglycinamide formyltransferase